MRVTRISVPVCTDFDDEKTYEDYVIHENEFLIKLLCGVLDGEFVVLVKSGLKSWILNRGTKKNQLVLTGYDEIMRPVYNATIRDLEDMWQFFPSCLHVYTISD